MRTRYPNGGHLRRGRESEGGLAVFVGAGAVATGNRQPRGNGLRESSGRIRPMGGGHRAAKLSRLPRLPPTAEFGRFVGLECFGAVCRHRYGGSRGLAGGRWSSNGRPDARAVFRTVFRAVFFVVSCADPGGVHTGSRRSLFLG